MELGGAGTDSIRHLEFPSRGILVDYFPNNNTKMTVGRGIARPPDYFGANCDDISNQTGETKTILGFTVLHVVSGDPTNALIDSWIAPALNCQPLLETITWPTSVTTKVATAALAAPPDQNLLTIPPDAQEQPPAVFYPGAGVAVRGGPNAAAGYARDAATRGGGN